MFAEYAECYDVSKHKVPGQAYPEGKEFSKQVKKKKLTEKRNRGKAFHAEGEWHDGAGQVPAPWYSEHEALAAGR